MESLRTRRTSGKPRQPPKKPASGNARKSTVDHRIKKRMSMRYADISLPTNLAEAPKLPPLPSSVRPQDREQEHEQDEFVGERGSDPQAEAWAANIRTLERADFDPDAYLRTKLANSTESEIKNLQTTLRSAKDATASELQRNVFKNYAEFVTISKEISILENEMLELKESLAEWRNMPSLLHIDDSASVAERKRNARSSIADLRVIYANQMQLLHSQIEGSAKFAPTTPGRHVVNEMDGILALNTATYKIERTVRFVVLNDAVLVARRRRRNRTGTEGGKLVAEKSWPIGELTVLDTKDTPSMTNVFKIRHGKESHVYRTESPSDKKALLLSFRHVAEELAAKKRREREGEHERRKSLWASGAEQRASLHLDKIPPLSDWIAELSQKLPEDGSLFKEKDENDARWVNEFADGLTVAIALREWERAVTLVEQGKDKLATVPSLAAKLTPLNASLTSALLQSLSSRNNRKSTVVQLISLLVRLNAGPAARTTFLAARTETTHRYIRLIRFEGHIGMYIADLSMVVFTGIKHTADWFLASFRENEVASCFIDWAKSQIEDYTMMFRTQVYGTDIDPKTVDEALRITYSQSKKLLQDYGLDFRFILHSLLKSKTLEIPPLEVPIPSPTLILDIGHTSEQDASPTTPPPTEALPSPQRLRTPVSRSRPPILRDPMPASDRDGPPSPVVVRRARTPPAVAAMSDVTERSRQWVGQAPPPRSNQRSARIPSAGSSNLRKEGAF